VAAVRAVSWQNVARLAFAALGVAAMAYQYGAIVYSGREPENFFWFFTIQSNILAAAVLALTATVPREARSPLFDAVRGAGTLYIAITGVVFALLLAGRQEEVQTSVEWVDFVLHRLVPIVVVLDWLIDPQRHRLPRWVAAAWLAYPLAWFAATLLRGEIVDWYPYPFVDVGRVGYDGVLLRAVVFVIAFALAAAALLWIGNRRAGRAAPRS
jgi:hypothetical protein